MNIERSVIFTIKKTPTVGLFCIAADTVALKWLCTQIVVEAEASRFSALCCFYICRSFLYQSPGLFFYSLIVLFRLFNTANTFYEDYKGICKIFLRRKAGVPLRVPFFYLIRVRVRVVL